MTAKQRRRDAVVETLATLGGSAPWLALGESGHNISTVMHCVTVGLLRQRSPTGARHFDLTALGWEHAATLRAEKAGS